MARSLTNKTFEKGAAKKTRQGKGKNSKPRGDRKRYRGQGR